MNQHAPLKILASGWGVFVTFLVVSLIFQTFCGVWKSDFGGHADEGAHVVTSLMVRDYIAGGWSTEIHPIRYAEHYYELFPKVAIGHYPPAFYVIAGLFLLPFRDPAVFPVLMAVFSGLVGWATWRLGSSVMKDQLSPVMIGLSVCLLPLSRMYTVTVMADLLLVLFCLLAVHAFSRFLKNESIEAAVWFGIWASAAILTKGSGLCLALVPLFGIPLARRWKLFLSPKLWVAPIPVALTALPWTWMTWEISAEGLYHGEWAGYVRSAISFYFHGLIGETGILIPIVISVALIYSHLAWKETDGDGHSVAAIVGFLFSTLAIVILIPTGVDTRYLLPFVAVALLLCGWFLEGRGRQYSQKLGNWLVPVFCVVVLGTTYRPVEKRYTGASESVAAILKLHEKAISDRERIKVLVVTDATGEGALTAAAAFQGPAKLHVYRGTKLLAKSDWMGRGYQIEFSSPEDFVGILVENGISYLIVEATPNSGAISEHWDRTTEVLSSLSPFIEVEKEDVINSLRKRGKETSFSLYRFKTKGLSLPSENETEL